MAQRTVALVCQLSILGVSLWLKGASLPHLALVDEQLYSSGSKIGCLVSGHCLTAFQVWKCLPACLHTVQQTLSRVVGLDALLSPYFPDTGTRFSALPFSSRDRLLGRPHRFKDTTGPCCEEGRRMS